MTDDELIAFFPACDRIAWAVCCRNSRCLFYLEDCQQEAHLACWLSSLRYNPLQGAFWPFAVLRVRGSVLTYLQSVRASWRNGRDYRFVPIEDAKLCYSCDPSAAIDLESVVEMVEERDQDIARRYFIDMDTAAEIAVGLTLTKKKIWNVVQRCHTSISDALFMSKVSNL